MTIIKLYGSTGRTTNAAVLALNFLSVDAINATQNGSWLEL